MAAREDGADELLDAALEALLEDDCVFSARNCLDFMLARYPDAHPHSLADLLKLTSTVEREYAIFCVARFRVTRLRPVAGDGSDDGIRGPRRVLRPAH